MNKTRQILFLAVTTSFLCTTAAAQTARTTENKITSSRAISTGTTDNGHFVFTYKLSVERIGDAPLPRLGGGSLVKGDTMQRWLMDEENRRYTGYDVRIETLSRTTCKVSFASLSAKPKELQLPSTRWTSFDLPSLPKPQILNQGETLAIELMVHPRTGQRIVEYISVEPKGPPVSFANASPARDFRLEDVELQFFDPQIKINGKLESTSTKRGVSGAVIWFQLPNRGRYSLSLLPHPSLGFKKAGEIRNKKLSFHWSGDNFEIDTSTPIAPSQGAWNLYVHRDASARYSEDSIGAADTAALAVKMD